MLPISLCFLEGKKYHYYRRWLTSSEVFLFLFSFWLISKRHERDNELFVVKKKSQRKSLVVWSSDIQILIWICVYSRGAC